MQEKINIYEVKVKRDYFQDRVSENQDWISEKTDMMKEAGAELEFTPIWLWNNPENDEYELLDGHHRLQVYKNCKRRTIPYIIPEGVKNFKERDEVIRWCIANVNNHKVQPLTTHEKIIRFQRYYLDTKNIKKSLGEIAKELKTPESTLKTWYYKKKYKIKQQRSAKIKELEKAKTIEVTRTDYLVDELFRRQDLNLFDLIDRLRKNEVIWNFFREHTDPNELFDDDEDLRELAYTYGHTFRENIGGEILCFQTENIVRRLTFCGAEEQFQKLLEQYSNLVQGFSPSHPKLRERLK